MVHGHEILQEDLATRLGLDHRRLLHCLRSPRRSRRFRTHQHLCRHRHLCHDPDHCPSSR